jgi:hypothetical protein
MRWLGGEMMTNKDLAYKAIDYIESEFWDRTIIEHLPDLRDELEEIIEEVRRKIMEAK